MEVELSEKISSELKNYNFNGKRVLDVGAGSSDFVQGARQRGASAWGVDLPGAMKWIRENYKAQVNLEHRVGASGEVLPFRENSVDLVVSSSFFSHAEDMPSLKMLTRDALRVLKPGNFLLFEKPDFFGDKKVGDPRYEEFDEWLWKGGFDIICR